MFNINFSNLPVTVREGDGFTTWQDLLDSSPHQAISAYQISRQQSIDLGLPVTDTVWMVVVFRWSLNYMTALGIPNAKGSKLYRAYRTTTWRDWEEV